MISHGCRHFVSEMVIPISSDAQFEAWTYPENIAENIGAKKTMEPTLDIVVYTD